MVQIDGVIRPIRKIKPLIYVIDTSAALAGVRIAEVNQAMAETIEVLKEVSAKNPTAELKIGVLQFASGASWVTDGLQSIDDFYWNDLIAGGPADLGAALDELHKKLSRIAFFNSEVGFKVPVLIFMSDGGYPTDDYRSALKKISDNNKWFTASTKICLAIDADSDLEVLREVGGCGDNAKGRESVIQVSDMETLKKLIRIVSVTASMIGGTFETISAIRYEMKDMDGVSILEEPEPMPDPDPPGEDVPDDPFYDEWD